MIPINFLAASRIQAAIECLPRTCADDHRDRYSAGKGEIEMSTFTPGKWVNEGLGCIATKELEICLVSKVDLVDGKFVRGEMSEASAELIADAPAMLDALADLLAYLEDGIGDHDSEEGKQARALIAKHRGGK